MVVTTINIYEKLGNNNKETISGHEHYNTNLSLESAIKRSMAKFSSN